jgi:hypothetical protein
MRKDLLERQEQMKASQPKRRGRPTKARRPKISDLPPIDHDLQRDLRLFWCHRMLERCVPLDRIAAELTGKFGEIVSIESIKHWDAAGRPLDLSALDSMS